MTLQKGCNNRSKPSRGETYSRAARNATGYESHCNVDSDGPMSCGSASISLSLGLQLQKALFCFRQIRLNIMRPDPLKSLICILHYPIDVFSKVGMGKGVQQTGFVARPHDLLRTRPAYRVVDCESSIQVLPIGYHAQKM